MAGCPRSGRDIGGRFFDGHVDSKADEQARRQAAVDAFAPKPRDRQPSLVRESGSAPASTVTRRRS